MNGPKADERYGDGPGVHRLRLTICLTADAGAAYPEPIAMKAEQGIPG